MLDQDPYQAAGLVVVFIFTPVCIIATGLRFWASRLSLGKVGIEDWLALGALITFLGWVGGSIVVVEILAGVRDPLNVPRKDTASSLLTIWIISFIYPINQVFAKFSILCLYHRIFGVNRNFTLWIRGIGFVQVLVLVGNLISNAIQCLPAQKYWMPWVDGYCVRPGVLLATLETTNSLVDFAMVILAIAILRKLQTKRSTIWKLGIIFALGGFAGIIGFIKIGFAFNVTVSNQIVQGFWSTVQMAFSVLCCCMMTYRPIFAKIHVFEKLGSKISSYTSRLRSLPQKSSLRRQTPMKISMDSLQESHRLATSTDDANKHVEVRTEVEVARHKREGTPHGEDYDPCYGYQSGVVITSAQQTASPL
ncbi:integral membrane protein [Nemania sp. FL0031]|nr:integral membrane protein [Nemania sp. FL0031]